MSNVTAWHRRNGRHDTTCWPRRRRQPFSRMFLVVQLVLLTGCAPNLWHIEDLSAKSSEYRCDPPATPLPLDVPVHSKPPSIYEQPNFSPDLSSQVHQIFSKPALQVADILGLRPLLEKLPKLEQTLQKGSIQEVTLLRMTYTREKLINRSMLASMEVMSVGAEAACEAARADRAAARLEIDQANKIKNQTLIAVTVAGAASIIGGALVLIPAKEIVGGVVANTSGIMETFFGSTALFTRSRQEFLHSRNILRELWENPEEPTIFPLPVWRYLHIPQYNDPEKRTLREQLIAGWRGEGRLGEQGSEDFQDRTKLLFGDGDLYEASDLRARAEMLEMLQATIKLFQQDLELLLREMLVREVQFEQGAQYNR